MRTILLVSPHFPPTNAVDMHRIRMSLPYLEEFGWQPIVLTVDRAYVEHPVDPMLLETIPAATPIHEVRALPATWTRKFGVGDLGLRALPFLYRGGARLIKDSRVDLVYLSTTVFTSMILGRAWYERFGVPYVLDMQDPWVGEYYKNKPQAERPPKYRLAQRLHRALEPWTMRKVGGIVAVSAAYHETLRQRYPWIGQEDCRTIPFGVSPSDFAVAAKGAAARSPARNHDKWVGLAVGVLGRPKRWICESLCHALRIGLERNPELFSRVRLQFVGTDYADDKRATPTMGPIARRLGIEHFIAEQTSRVPYFEALRSLQNADFLLLLGSDDPQYMPSKLYTYLAARRPLLAVFHKDSGAAMSIRDSGAGELVTFASIMNGREFAQSLADGWQRLLQRLPFTPYVNPELLGRYSAREMTRQQCELFDHVHAAQTAWQMNPIARGPDRALPESARLG